MEGSKKGEGIKQQQQKTNKKPHRHKQYGDNRKKGTWWEVEEDKGGMNGDGKELGVVNTQYSIQWRYYKIVPLKSIYLTNQCHPNKFNSKKR